MFDPLNARCFVFRSELPLSTNQKNELRNIFSLYTDSSVTKQEDILYEWHKNIYEYSEDTWFIFMDTKTQTITDDIEKAMSNTEWYIIQIGDDYDAFANSEFLEWMRYHLDY